MRSTPVRWSAATAIKIAMINPCPIKSTRPNGQTAAVKMTSNAIADSRRINGVQRSPNPRVNSVTPAIGMNTSLGMPNVRNGFSTTNG